MPDRSPAGWRYRVLVNKHASGPPRPGEMSMLDIFHQEVWGVPGAWRYSDGPDKPRVDWMFEAEPLYSATKEEDPNAQRLLNVARGCHDYGGGYRESREREIFHHGIQTVIKALEAAEAGPDRFQVRVLESIGAAVAEAVTQEGTTL